MNENKTNKTLIKEVQGLAPIHRASEERQLSQSRRQALTAQPEGEFYGALALALSRLAFLGSGKRSAPQP